jgi:hypothetical protein
MVAMMVAVVRIQRKCCPGKGKGTMAPDQHRQSKGNAMMVS